MNILSNLNYNYNFYSYYICICVDEFNFSEKIVSDINELFFGNNIKPKQIIINYKSTNVTVLDNTMINTVLFNKINSYDEIFIYLLNNINNISDDINNGKIIFLFDTSLKNNSLMLTNVIEYFELCYQLYGCESIIETKNYEDFYYNNLLFSEKLINKDKTNIFFGKLISIKTKYIKLLYEYADSNKNKYDLNNFFVNFFSLYKLYLCNFNSNILLKSLDLINIENLCNSSDYKINNIDLNDIVYEPSFKIETNIYKRTLLFNVSNIKSVIDENTYKFIHIDIKYFNDKIFLLTITKFNNNFNIYNKIILKINGKDFILSLNPVCDSYKNTFLISINDNIKRQKNVTIDNLILQTSNINTMFRYKYYSIYTILNNLPYLNYAFFSNDDVEMYLSHFKNPLIKIIYDILIPGAYKSDFFRALFAYNNGCLYFDCKMVLHSDLIDYFNHDYFFTLDTKENFLYNAFFYMKNAYNKQLLMYLKELSFNVLTQNYGKNAFSITGPELFGKYFHSNIFFKNNNSICSQISETYITNHNNEIIIKNSYPNYYLDNNYITNGHYYQMWLDKIVFDKNLANNYFIEKKINSFNDKSDFQLIFSVVNNVLVYCNVLNSNSDSSIKYLNCLKEKIKTIKYNVIKLIDSSYFIPKHVKHKFKPLSDFDIISLLNKLNSIMQCDKLNDSDKLIILNSNLSIDEILLNSTIDKNTLNFIENLNYDIIFFEPLNNFNNKLFPLHKYNNKSLNYNFYACNKSLIDKVNKILKYHENIEEIQFNSKQISNFETLILSNLNVYIYGKSDEDLNDINYDNNLKITFDEDFSDELFLNNHL